jgi:hypothetical protein
VFCIPFSGVCLLAQNDNQELHQLSSWISQGAGRLEEPSLCYKLWVSIPFFALPKHLMHQLKLFTE